MNTEKTLTHFVKWFEIRPKTSGYLLTFVILFFVFLISFQQYQILKKEQEREMSVILNNIHENIDQSLKNCQSTITSLALTISDDGIQQNFDSVSKQLLNSNPDLSVVTLAPNGVIKHIYPLKGNEAAMNLNVFDSKSFQEEAYKFTKTRKVFFEGPIKIKQGGVSILARLPVYKKNNFWGFTSAVINFKKLLKASGTNSIDSTKYSFQFSKINPISQKEEFYLPSKIDLTKNHYVSFSIPDSNWKIYLIKKNPNEIYLSYLFRGILGIMIAIFFGLFTTKILKNPEKLRVLLKEQETRLLANEMKFKMIFDQASVGFAIVDANSGVFIELNEKFSTILGHPQEHIIGNEFTFFTHPDDIAENMSNFKKLQTGTISDYSTEKRYITSFGKPIWVNLTVSPLWKGNKKPTQNMVFIKDITSNKESQLLVRKSELRFRSIFDNSPLPLLEADFSVVKKRIVELDLINKNAQSVLSYFDENPEEVFNCMGLIKIVDVNAECIKLHKVKDKETYLNNINPLTDIESINDIKLQLVAIAQNDQDFRIDSRIKNRDGQYRDIDLRWNVRTGYEDSYRAVIFSAQDITDRKTSELAIFNSHQRTESIINTIDGIVWEYDLQTMSSTFISKKVEQILGYSVEDYMSNKTFWEDHIYSEDRELALGLSSIVNGRYQDHDYEYRMIAKDGKIIWIRDIVNFVYENEKPIISRGIMIDITIMKEAERDLSNSFNLVSEQNKRLLNFSYIVSHNLRSHTSNIESIISLIDSAESEDERVEMMKLLKSVSISLDDTMTHLNEVVNINTNLSLVIKPLKLHHYINKAINVLSEKIQLNEASFILDVPDDAMINYNSAYLESILFNLISNAIRYKHPQRKPIITIKLYKKRDKDVLEISDNGIGIDLEKNGDKIFGMYKTFSNNSDARGIGLFITKNQIDAMEGNITVESIPTTGTTFKIFTK
jgi:PAS domain S-box-containing protein